MTSRNALLSLSSGVQEKYIFQVIKTTKISEKTTRLTLSDGNAYISADVPVAKLSQHVGQYSLVKVELKYYGLGYPVEVKTLEIVEGKYGFLMGKPIPFVDYINKGFRSEDSANQSGQQKRKVMVDEQPRFFRDSNKTNKPIIDIDQNDNDLGQVVQQDTPFDPYVCIDKLQPRMSKWKILARVSWMDSKMILVKAGTKAGQRVLVVNFFIMDRLAKQIKCSCFDQAAIKFQQILKINSVFEFANGKIFEQPQQHANRKFMNIRFQLFSTIVEVKEPMFHIPWHSYNLTPMDKLQSYGQDQELDVAGIVKAILKKEDTNSTKLRLTIVLADPLLQKEIDVLLYLEPEQASKIVQFNPVILKNIKIVSAEQGTISLKSCFNTHYLTNFQPQQQGIKIFQVYKGKDIEKEEYESLSKINYHLRSLNQHLQTLELCFGEQKVFSKVNCYFVSPFGEKKYYYEACVKCFKKVNNVNKKSSFCEKCRKIVELREQYLLKSQFVDWSRHIKLTLVGDYAKAILKYQPSDFVKMSQDQQADHINSVKFTQVCLYLKSWKVKQAFNHNVQIIQKPHNLGLVKIQRILAGVKDQEE